ncbi:DUF4113 domain-containing protein, partial [Escherichia coli]|uniref:DUF4113 domain-containing protein n=1 Tax=Escherichia coli TaxID=562 RepID=UPI0027388F8D
TKPARIIGARRTELLSSHMNQSGKGKVWFAGRGTAPEWQMKREMLSPSYTTQWTEIPIASF